MTEDQTRELTDKLEQIADAVNERSELTAALAEIDKLEACETAPNTMDDKIEELSTAVSECQDTIREAVREIAHLLQRPDICVGLGV